MQDLTKCGLIRHAYYNSLSKTLPEDKARQKCLARNLILCLEGAKVRLNCSAIVKEDMSSLSKDHPIVPT